MNRDPSTDETPTAAVMAELDRRLDDLERDLVKPTDAAVRKAAGVAVAHLVGNPDAQRAHIPTLLVVDPDGVSRRFVELIVQREAGWQVEAAKDATSAFDILQTQRVDIIVCERDLPDMTGLTFREKLGQQGRLKDIPVALFTADSKTETRVLAFRNGFDEVFKKPIEPQELVARLSTLVDRQRVLRDRLRQRSYMLAGDFSVMAFPDLVGTLEMQRRTGTLAITTSQAVGELLISAGKILHVHYGSLTGAAAFYAMMREPKGQFEFNQRPITLEEDQRNVTASATSLILEGARLADEARLTGMPLAPMPPRPVDTAPPTQVEKPEGLSVALAPQLEHAVKDLYTLGELRFLTLPELTEWTRSTRARERLHVHLVAPIDAGVAALLTLAAPQTEHDVLAGMAPALKTLNLAFFLRNERMLDIQLVDIAAADAQLKHLRRQPTLTILAPPQGDFLSVGTRARVSLEALLTERRPRAVIASGNASLHAHLSELNSVREGRFPVECALGDFSGGGADLRELLARGIRLWASTARGHTEDAP